MDINSSMNGELNIGMIKPLFCDGVHKLKGGKSDTFTSGRKNEEIL